MSGEGSDESGGKRDWVPNAARAWSRYALRRSCQACSESAGRATGTSTMGRIQDEWRGLQVRLGGLWAWCRTPVGERWLSMAMCGTAAAAVTHATLLLLSPLIYDGELWRRIVNRPVLMVTSAAILAAILIGRSGRHRWAGFLGSRYFWSYPPLSLAVFVGMVAYSGLALLPPMSTHAVIPATWLLLTPLIAAVFVGAQAIWPRLVTSSDPAAQSTPSTPGSAAGRDAARIDESLDALLRWISTDTPVTTSADDRFEMTTVARRIANRLANAQGKPPSIAILGRRGSGKSTIRNLVQHEMRAVPRFLHITISLWPFESAEAAVRGVLRAMIDEVGRHVNVLPLRGIADEYASVVAASAPRLREFVSAANQATPEGAIDRLRGILDAIQLHCVLWIDDLERFAGEDTLSPANAGIREVERLGPIRALLHLLDHQDHISVILCDASLHSRFDVDKIAQYIERPPDLNPELVWRVIERLRSACRGGYPRPFIDAATKGERDRITVPDSEIGRWVWLHDAFDTDTIGWAIGRICRTPRTLKSGLRAAAEAWNALCGEVDLDDVIVASLLRAARPDVFLLLATHTDHFRSPNRSDLLADAHGKAPPPHDADVAMDAFLEREETASERRAVEIVVKFLFPAFRGGLVTGSDQTWMRPQGFAGPFATDYLQRYLTLVPIVAAESDQLLLSAIRQWRNGKPSDLIASMLNPDVSARVARFVHQFTPSDCCRLLVDVVAALLIQRMDGESRNALPSQLIHVGGMLLAARQGAWVDESELVSALQSAIDRAMGDDLSLALAVIRVFAWEQSGPGRSLLSDASRTELSRRWCDCMVRAFVEPGTGNIVKALQGCVGSALYLACLPFGVARESKMLKPLWPGLSSAILSAISLGGAPILRQVLPFVTWDEDMETQPPLLYSVKVDMKDWLGGGGGGVQVDGGSIERLFDVLRFIEVVREVDLTGLQDGRDSVRARALQRWARSTQTEPRGLEPERDGSPAPS